MKTTPLIKACGSIVKRESLLPIQYNILKNTCVAEASEPYAAYYGNVPQPAIPNSLFLFTSQYYALEDVLRIAQNIDSCYMEKVNVAAASLDFGQQKYSAIRIKHFPDFEHLHLLQRCCKKEGVEFIKKVQMSESALVKISKCFVLEETAQGVYIDKKEDHRGYISIPGQLTYDQFLNAISKIRNNEDCPLFDAAMGAMILDSKAVTMVRVFSENLDLKLLKCIKERFAKSIPKAEIL